jgi:catechol 2,3-dioxygenase-like lactoylglutathione lyase family enzyme
MTAIMPALLMRSAGRPGSSTKEDLNMTDLAVSERIAHRWYARPVLFVSDLHGALRFYIDKLGFKKRWHDDDGNGTVCQVNRGDCEIILCEDAARRDKGRLFVALTRDGLEELGREIVERSVPVQKAWWGYDVIRIADPDGNELLFPLESE